MKNIQIKTPENIEKISIPNGLEIDLETSSLEKGIINFKKTEIKLPTTNAECLPFLSKNCYYVNNTGGISVDDTYKAGPNKITSKKYAEAFLALMQLIKFRDIWNKGWVVDWSDNTVKHVIYFYQNKKKGGEMRWTGSVLNFKTYQIRNDFSIQFDDLIQKAKPLL